MHGENACFTFTLTSNTPAVCMVGIALLGGIITFFASCLFPLVPIYLAYLTGIATNSLSETTLPKQNHNNKIITHSLTFVLGFILIFIILGALASYLGSFILPYRHIIQKISGVFFIIMGLFILKIIHPKFLYKELKFNTKKNLTKWAYLNTFIAGMSFGFAWTPCVGPVLSLILYWATYTQTIAQGIVLLTIYGIGLGIPFLIFGIGLEYFSAKVKIITKHSNIINFISGIVLIIAGILIFQGRIDYISTKILQILNLNSLAI